MRNNSNWKEVENYAYYGDGRAKRGRRVKDDLLSLDAVYLVERRWLDWSVTRSQFQSRGSSWIGRFSGQQDRTKDEWRWESVIPKMPEAAAKRPLHADSGCNACPKPTPRANR